MALPDLVAVAPRDLEWVLRQEVGSRLLLESGRLFFLSGVHEPVWAQNIWRSPRVARIESVSAGAKLLRGIQRNWWLHSHVEHRRAQLIQDQLAPFNPKLHEFGRALPRAPLGSWTLLDRGHLLYSADCSSLFRDGEVNFVENRVEPPSRAYLKLWELFTLLGARPPRGAKVLDLGASPGGWTWVLEQLGCQVLSVDRAELAPALMESSSVQFIKQNAFSLKPEDIAFSDDPVEWMFSDIICYPEKLLELVCKWAPHVPNMVCTIKFQGEGGHAIVNDFLKIPGSRVQHLSCNKHELTWYRIRECGSV